MKKIIIIVFEFWMKLQANLWKDAKAAMWTSFKCWLPLAAIVFMYWLKGGFG
jgi:hypothetical protein